MWFNQKADDKNLESLLNEFTLENIRGANVLDEIPDETEIGEGELRLVTVSGDLRIYTKHNGNLKYVTFT